MTRVQHVGSPCYHPLSCRQCDIEGSPCGGHIVGESEHKRCKGTPSEDHIVVTNDRGLRFGVVIVREGERYGLNGVLVHDEPERPLVEFYDMRYPFHPLKVGGNIKGQFVSRYYAGTLLGTDDYSTGPHRRALDLDGGIADWKIDGRAMNEVIDWLEEKIG